MADVKIVDIDNVQWNMKDEMARNKITEVNTTLENYKTRIEGLEKNSYLRNRTSNYVFDGQPKWFKIEGLYSSNFLETNVFSLISRNGEYHNLCCGLTDNYQPFQPVWIKFVGSTNKISRICYKNGIIWVLLSGYSSFYVQQIAGDTASFITSEENPPADAVEITMNTITQV